MDGSGLPLNWPRRLALFLTPARKDFDLLALLIEECSKRANHPPFEPHVTLYTGTFVDPTNVGRALCAAIEGIPPVTLHAEGVRCTREYFRSLFIQFRDDPSLRAIHERFRDECGVSSGYELHPHLSLLYADLPLPEKESLAKRVVLPHDSFRFDRVRLVSPADAVAGWRDTGGWETLMELELTGNGSGIGPEAIQTGKDRNGN